MPEGATRSAGGVRTGVIGSRWMEWCDGDVVTATTRWSDEEDADA